jgi:hypothetical protein
MLLANPLSKEPMKYLEARLQKGDCEMPQVEMFCRAIQKGVLVSCIHAFHTMNLSSQVLLNFNLCV